MNPFRFGVSVWHAPSRANWIAKARKIEDLGYTLAKIARHVYQHTAASLAGRLQQGARRLDRQGLRSRNEQYARGPALGKEHITNLCYPICYPIL